MAAPLSSLVVSDFRDIAILGLGQEDQRDDEAHRRNADRIPEARVDIAGRRHDGEHRRRQEAAEPAIADVIRQRQAAVADAGREQFDQPSGDRSVHHGHIDDQDDQQQHRHRIVDVGRVGARRIAVAPSPPRRSSWRRPAYRRRYFDRRL